MQYSHSLHGRVTWTTNSFLLKSISTRNEEKSREFEPALRYIFHLFLYSSPDTDRKKETEGVRLSNPQTSVQHFFSFCTVLELSTVPSAVALRQKVVCNDIITATAGFDSIPRSQLHFFRNGRFFVFSIGSGRGKSSVRA